MAYHYLIAILHFCFCYLISSLWLSHIHSICYLKCNDLLDNTPLSNNSLHLKQFSIGTLTNTTKSYL